MWVAGELSFVSFTHNIFIPPRKQVWGGVYRNHSVRLSVQVRVRAITSLFFEVGIPYLAYGCITMRRCVMYIDDLCMTLTFDLEIKNIGFLT